MSDILFPIILTIAGIIVALTAYQNIRQGGARFYTLEREAMLRRASYRVGIAVLLFIGAIGLLIYDQQPVTEEVEPGVVNGEVMEAATPTSSADLELLPPEPTLTPTIDPFAIVPTPTSVLIRAQVTGTGGAGLYMRTEPSTTSETLFQLPDGAIVSLLEDEPVDDGTFVWRKVRTVAGDQGWVVEQYLDIGNGQ